MGRLGNAVAALRGKSLPASGAGPIKPGQITGNPAILSAGRGIVAGTTPFGAPPLRGAKDLIVAAKKSPTLWAVTDKIAQNVAAVPWRAYMSKSGKNGKASLDGALRYRAKRAEIMGKSALSMSVAQDRAKQLDAAKQDEDLVEIIDHPLLEMLRNGNPMMTGMSVRALTQKYLDLGGESFWILERNSAGVPVQCWPIPFFWVYRTPAPGRPYYHIVFATYQMLVPETDIVWIKHLDLENPFWRGTGTGFALGDPIETLQYAYKVQKEFFYNNATPPLIVSMEDADEEEIIKLRQNWEDSHRGIWNQMRTMFTNLKFSVESLMPTFSDQKLIQLQAAMSDTITQIYGVPPELLGKLEHSNKSTADAAVYFFSENCMVPRLEFLLAEFNRRLVPEYDDALILEYESPTPADQDHQLAVATAAKEVLTVNEWRAMGNHPPRDDGDVYYRELTPADQPGVPANQKPGDASDAGDEDDADEKDDEEASKTSRPYVVRAEEDEDDDQLTDAQADYVSEAVVSGALADGLDAVMARELDTWGSKVMTDLGIDLDFDLANPLVKEHLADIAANRVGGISDTTRQMIRDALSAGVGEGEGIDDLASRLEAIDDDVGDRSETIARTEVMRSSNFATQAAAKQSGAVERKEWISTKGQSDPREGHEELDGKVIGLDEEFENPQTGAKAQYPGDFDDAAEVVNCHCLSWPSTKVDDSKSKDARGALAKKIMRRRAVWEDSAQRAIAKGLHAQVRAAIKRLKSMKGDTRLRRLAA